MHFYFAAGCLPASDPLLEKALGTQSPGIGMTGRDRRIHIEPACLDIEKPGVLFWDFEGRIAFLPAVDCWKRSLLPRGETAHPGRPCRALRSDATTAFPIPRQHVPTSRPRVAPGEHSRCPRDRQADKCGCRPNGCRGRAGE